MKHLLIAAMAFLMAAPVFAQQKPVKKDSTMHQHAVYTCPMHPDVVSDKPGKCPKCGMTLNLSTKEKMKMEVMKQYTCPMHPDVVSDKPGKCPKCGMTLVEKKPATKKMKKDSTMKM